MTTVVGETTTRDEFQPRLSLAPPPIIRHHRSLALNRSIFHLNMVIDSHVN